MGGHRGRRRRRSPGFYGGLFGWTFTQATPPEAPVRYLVAQLDGQDVAGIGSRAASSTATPRWNTYVAVDDIEAAASRVVAAGGRVIDPPSDAGEGGRAATCADPAGVQFRLWQARRRLGAQITNTPGSWNFSDLVASDHEASARFYGQVFGWEFDDLGFSTMVRRPGYGDHLASTIDPGIHERQSGDGVPPGLRRRDRVAEPCRRRRPRLAGHFHGGRPRRDCGEGRGTGRQGGTPRGHRLDQGCGDRRPHGRGVHRQPVHPA